MASVVELRRVTYNELVLKLKEYGKCALIRCTGFCKTFMLAKLAKRYKRVLYLYPADCVKQTVEARGCENIEFLTYAKTAKMTIDDYKGYDLIILDECHRIGAVKTRLGLEKLFRINPTAHIVGATATPDRMDMIDVVSEFFEGITVSEYTLHQAFIDGVIKRPYYVYCTYDVEADIRKEALKLDLDENEVQSVIDSRYIEVANLFGMSRVIRDTCSSRLKDTSYMKFIVFFKNTAHMDDKGDSVYEWFNEAFPDHNINILSVRSDRKSLHDNVKKLNDLKRQKDTIDLIFCIDMLNMGYHVSDLTGIVMYRGTESGTVYIQQLGRALSTGSRKSAIVFDVVDNLHRKAIYDDVQYDENVRIRKLVKKKVKEVERELNRELTSEEFNVIYNKISETYKASWWHHTNDIIASDFIVSDHRARYEELIAKLVAEPMVQRIEAAHRDWLERGGIEKPFTKENWGNPSGDERVPLQVSCYLYNVKIQEVMKYYGVI